MYNEDDREFELNNSEETEKMKEENIEAQAAASTETENIEAQAAASTETENIEAQAAASTETESHEVQEEIKADESKENAEIEKEEEIKTERRAPYEPIKDSYYKETVKHTKKKSSFKKILAACAVISLCGGVGIGGAYSVLQNTVFGKADSTPSANESADDTSDAGKTSVKASFVSTGGSDAVEVIENVYPAIVNINTSVHSTANYYGISIPYDSQGAGSGVIFNEDDQYVYIVTNNHVIEDATDIYVSVTGNESISATLVGTDSTADIAVIKALKSDFTGAEVEYKIAKFADSDKLKVGESVIAIGNALGEGKSATGGMISVLNKTIEVNGQALSVIQTSAPINPGNSGGALVNYDGEIIGINTAKTSTSVAEGMGYAIPSSTAKEVMERLLVDGTTPKPYLGIMGADITDELSQLYKLPVGVLVSQVLEGGAAEKAGVQSGDIITSFNGKTVMDMEDLQAALKNSEIGSTVEMNIIRNGDESMTLKVTVMDANE